MDEKKDNSESLKNVSREVRRPETTRGSRPTSTAQAVVRPSNTSSGRRPSATTSTSSKATSTRPAIISESGRRSDTAATSSTSKPYVENLPDKVRTVMCECPFEFLGNMNNVKVTSQNSLGDGDMNGSIVTYVQVDGNYKIEGNLLKIQITYTVVENGYAKNKKADKLTMTGYYTQDLDKLFGGLAPTSKKGELKVTTETKSWKLLSDQRPTSYKAGVISINDSSSSKNYMYLDYNMAPAYNNANKSEWLPLDEILVKVDGKGSELYGQGNLAIKGRAIFYFELTTKTQIAYDPIEAYEIGSDKLLEGYNPVLDTIPQEVRTVLGRGYDITGAYAEPSYRCSPVINVDEVNKKKLLLVTNRGKMDGRTFKGESKEELSSSYESQLSIKVSANGFGATFSNETKKTVKKESSYNESRKYVSISKVYTKKIYSVDASPNTAGMASLLTEAFVNDLDRKTPEQIIEIYGTHVMMGMVIGARLTYNMSYVKSIEKLSEAQTFSTVTSVGYSCDPTSGVKPATENEKDKQNKKDISTAELAAKALEKDVSEGKLKELNTLINTLTKTDTKLNSDKDGGKKDNKPTLGSYGISVSSEYSVNTSESSSFENESLEDSCTVIGGNTMLENYICSDLTNINKWQDSITDSNSNSWADFEAGKLIPIYEFVPVGHKVTANALKNAWEKYLEGVKSVRECGRTEIVQNFSITGSNDTVHTLNKCDREISSANGKETGWKLYLEPVNLDGGNVAVAVQLTVGESGLDGNRSLLRLHQVVTLPKTNFKSIAVDTSNLASNSYEVTGRFFKKCSGMYDITYLMRGCPFLETKSNHVFISVDGSGDNDSKNLKVQGVFRVPVIGYDK